MKITRQFVNGKWEPPFTPEEEAACSAAFSEMCRSKIPPGSRGTERALMEGDVLNHGISDLPLPLQAMYVEKARKAGVSVQGKVYKSGLAAYPGDPRAWIGGIDDMKDIARERNLIVKGAVNHEGYVPDPTPDVPLAESSIKSIAAEYILNGKALPKDPVEAREMIVEKHGSPAKFKGAAHRPNGPLKKLPTCKTIVDD